jgi:hypothetical protein
MSIFHGPAIAQRQQQWHAEEKKRAEEEARARTFDLGRVIPALITSIVTANPTPLILAGVGEGARAATGSQTDIAGLSQMAGQQFMPTQGQGQSGMGALGTMPQPREQSQQKAFMQMLAQSGKLPMESFEHGGVKYKRENFMDQMMNSPAGMQMMEMMMQSFGGVQGAGPKIQAPAAFEALEAGTGKRIISDDGKNWRYAE